MMLKLNLLIPSRCRCLRPTIHHQSEGSIQTSMSEVAALATDRGQVRSASISSYRDVRNGRQQLNDEGALVFAHRTNLLG